MTNMPKNDVENGLEEYIPIPNAEPKSRRTRRSLSQLLQDPFFLSRVVFPFFPVLNLILLLSILNSPLKDAQIRCMCNFSMHQSLVIKARVEDMQATEEAIFDLTESLGTFFMQEDVYFNVPHGHLKLRIMHPNRCGQLIFNSSSKLSGHKMSESQVTEVEDVFNIRATLGAALGELGVIRKKRRVFVTEDIRIYLDDVDEIGHFVDVAVTMKSKDKDHDASCAKAADIRKRLGIKEENVVPVAYLDLLMRNCSFDDVEDSSTQGSAGDSKPSSDIESEDSA